MSKNGKKLPATVGATIDEVFRRRATRARHDAAAAVEQCRIDELEAHALRLMGAQGLDSGTGRRARATRSERIVPHLVDWEVFEKFVLRKKALDLLQRRVSATAWRERADDGVVVPGVEPIKLVSLHVTAVKR